MAEQKFLPNAWHFEIKDKIVSNIYLDIWVACVQTSPISFVARGKGTLWGNRRRLHAGKYLSPFFGNETSKCSHWREKGPKGRGFSHPISSKITLGKERKAKIERARRKKGGKEEKNNGWSPSFYLLATFDIGFWLKKKKLDRRVLFGGSVLKNRVLLLRRNDTLFTDPLVFTRWGTQNKRNLPH